jgi:hypothetical protein
MDYSINEIEGLEKLEGLVKDVIRCDSDKFYCATCHKEAIHIGYFLEKLSCSSSVLIRMNRGPEFEWHDCYRVFDILKSTQSILYEIKGIQLELPLKI